MAIQVVRDRITRSELEALASETYGEMIKAVADVERDVIAVGGALHADAEAVLIGEGADPGSLWGFNIYFHDSISDSLEYTSLINVRPLDHNRSLLIKDEKLRQRILDIVEKLVDWRT